MWGKEKISKSCASKVLCIKWSQGSETCFGKEGKQFPSVTRWHAWAVPGQHSKRRTCYVLSIIHILETSAENLICLFSFFGFPHVPIFIPPSVISWGTPCGWWGDVLHCLSDSRRLILFPFYSEGLCRCLRDSGEIFFSLCFWHFRQNHNVTKLVEIWDR